MSYDWQRFKIWRDLSPEIFENSAWQDKNALIHSHQLKAALDGLVAPDVLAEIEAGLTKVGMSIRINPYIAALIDWSNAARDPIRRQFLPMISELEHDHPCLVVDSLAEQTHSPTQSLVHRYPDKVLFLVTSVCPVYCQYCTRSYAVGTDTPLVHKEHVTSNKSWHAALDYISAHPQIEDIVVSGGDVARLKASHVRELGEALLNIEHIRRIRFATKAISVQPMKFLHDHEWMEALLSVIEQGRAQFKDVCIHTHFNHPSEITPMVERVMRRLHARGVVVRNQTVLLRGVNDDAETLRTLIKRLSWLTIHPYYVYLCDMVKGTEHFRVSLRQAQQLEKNVRGATAGFNTPLFIVDTPAGKRDVHSAEFYIEKYGVSSFTAPIVAPGQMFEYFDPIRCLPRAGQEAWRHRSREDILAEITCGDFVGDVPWLPETNAADRYAALPVLL
ncbi:KamA family radical SAM protein [Acidocella sp.]|jgi:lysine 2,3-aminomutase|uniref:KamA family radical SAM protein n=1 Tax=Acidocella sp. TaxID=50710 RepID=UPI002F40D2F2